MEQLHYDKTRRFLHECLTMNHEQYNQFLPEVEALVQQHVGDKVYFRGLIELSNICVKDCYYCGIRRTNSTAHRYQLSLDDVMSAVDISYDQHYGSIVIQAGERCDKAFVDYISSILKEIKQKYDGKLGVTLSLGEQSKATLQKWFELGAHRYLLRIETSNRELYRKWHPNNCLHDYDKRIETLRTLREVGYQVGTGVLIGGPSQTVEDLVEDLLFFQSIDVDMIGMGPFISHPNTPFYNKNETNEDLKSRYTLALRMISALRWLMPNINIAAATSLQAIDPMGREMAVKAGANIIMPNVTPKQSRVDYQLYPNKPCVDEEAWECKGCLDARLSMVDKSVGYNEWGDSPHFFERL
ncbi:[FeFe] hydrogenase H-cluster radical SAM maturase HydE [Halosquirtibacter xylanolyticus]|uniref:[FeFe] hydrogenase H-cluster radical SAM maturase HydE n=1 Tax=Halosquirtibacter xylanolyticus TaxID=3374599 RepID=UPI003749E68E|nr:[FeFe] hydrogenase H-cluster radical SAM maturase HydE [Prolixibacteraceae bacterium]